MTVVSSVVYPEQSTTFTQNTDSAVAVQFTLRHKACTLSDPNKTVSQSCIIKRKETSSENVVPTCPDSLSALTASHCVGGTQLF